MPSLPPPSRIPELALQTAPCLHDIERLVDLLQGDVDLQQGLVSAFRRMGGDVRRRCVSQAARETLGVWFSSPRDQDEILARERGLAHVAPLPSGSNYGLFFSRTLLDRGIRAALNGLPSKRLDTSGRFDPDGPVHLTSASMELLPPDRVRTVIKGFDDRPVPDVGFRLTITDTIGVRDGAVTCLRTTRDLDTDTDLLAVLSLVFAPTGLMFFFLAELLAAKLLGRAPSASAADCWVRAVVPTGVSIPGGRKLTFRWRNAKVTHAGLHVGSEGVAFDLGPRDPDLAVTGPRRLLAPPLGAVRQVHGTYRIVTRDMRGPLNVRWQLDGRQIASGRDVILQNLSFPVAPAGPRRIRALVTDADGLGRFDELTVTVGRMPMP